MEVNFNDPDEAVSLARFRTYLNYLIAINRYFKETDILKDLKEVVQSKQYQEIQGGGSV